MDFFPYAMVDPNFSPFDNIPFNLIMIVNICANLKHRVSTMGELSVPRSQGDRGGVLSAPGVLCPTSHWRGWDGGGGGRGCTECTGPSESTRVTA